MSPTELRSAREAVLTRLLDAENNQDLEAICAEFPHPRYELVGTHKIYDGRDQVGHYLKERSAAFPDYRYELVTLHHADDAVIAVVVVTGTLLGAIESTGDPIDPTGRGFHCRMAVFYLFRGDRLDAARIYFDTATIARQLA